MSAAAVAVSVVVWLVVLVGCITVQQICRRLRATATFKAPTMASRPLSPAATPASAAVFVQHVADRHDADTN